MPRPRIGQTFNPDFNSMPRPRIGQGFNQGVSSMNVFSSGLGGGLTNMGATQNLAGQGAESFRRLVGGDLFGHGVGDAAAGFGARLGHGYGMVNSGAGAPSDNETLKMMGNFAAQALPIAFGAMTGGVAAPTISSAIQGVAGFANTMVKDPTSYLGTSGPFGKVNMQGGSATQAPAGFYDEKAGVGQRPSATWNDIFGRKPAQNIILNRTPLSAAQRQQRQQQYEDQKAAKLSPRGRAQYQAAMNRRQMSQQAPSYAAPPGMYNGYSKGGSIFSSLWDRLDDGVREITLNPAQFVLGTTGKALGSALGLGGKGEQWGRDIGHAVDKFIAPKPRYKGDTRYLKRAPTRNAPSIPIPFAKGGHVLSKTDSFRAHFK